MPELRRTLGDVYGAPAGGGQQKQNRDKTGLDDDLAAALSAALINAPVSGPGGGPAAPAPAAAPATSLTGTLRELGRDPLPPPEPARPAQAAAPATGTPAATQAAAPGSSAGTASTASTASTATPAFEPLPGQPWRREDDDILPSGGGAGPARKSIHLRRR